MKVTQNDLDRYAQPLADDFCRRLHDQNGDRVDNVTVLCYLDTERRYASQCAAAVLEDALPAVPNALDFSGSTRVLVMAFAPAFDEQGTDANFYTNRAVTAVYPFLRKQEKRSADEMIRLSLFDSLSAWAYRSYGFPRLMGFVRDRDIPSAYSDAYMVEGRASDRLARKWAEKGLPERIFPGKEKPKPTGLLDRRALLCTCREGVLLDDAHPLAVHRECQRVPVRLRETAAMDPAELRRRVTPIVAAWLECRWPRYYFQKGEAWAQWRKHLVLDTVTDAEKRVREAQRAHASALEEMAAPAA